MRRMGMYKVGDRVRVTNLIVNPRSWKVDIGDVFTVNKVDSAGDLYVRSLENQNRLLIESEVEKVEEEIKVKEFKVGDKVKVLVEGSFGSDAEKGRIYTIETVDYVDNSLELEDLPELPAFDGWVEMSDVELVSESSYKVGDKVKVLTEDPCSSGAEKGKVYTVKEVDGSGIRLKEIAHLGGWVPSHHVELATNQTEFTFPEMAQKLIDGDFEVGTELVNGYKGYEKSYWVNVSSRTGNFGLSHNNDTSSLEVYLEGTDINGTWSVKEEPIKEMSIEELQKELGYKIKITE